MRVLLAPDRFSGTLTAAQAAQAIAEGWAAQAPADDLSTVPMSDGSAGLLDVVHAARGGRVSPVTVPGPLGEPVPAAVLHVPGAGGGTAFVEADQAIGTHLLRGDDETRRAAVRGTSAGLGRLLRAAVGTGAGRLVVGLPGTAAVHDGGAGMLAELAALPGDHPLRAGGLALRGLTDADCAPAAAAAGALGGAEVLLAAADDAPLLGLHGAGALLGQRPAVGPALAQELESAVGTGVARLEPHLRARTSLPVVGAPAGRGARATGAGAGGGAGFALAGLGARTMPGADVVAEEVGLARLVAAAELVVTGSRLLDVVAISRSVVATVSTAAMEHGLPVVVIAEEIHTNRRELAAIGVSGAYEVVERRVDGVPRPATPALARDALAVRARRLARTWSA